MFAILRFTNVLGKLGAASYFATSAYYSSHQQFSPANSKGERYMILARVVTGAFCKGNSGLKKSPYKPGRGFQEYDSVVDDVSKPSMYAVFHDHAAYPEYVIKYKY